MSRPATPTRHLCQTSVRQCSGCGAHDEHCQRHPKPPTRQQLVSLVERYRRQRADGVIADVDAPGWALEIESTLQACQAADVARVRAHALSAGKTRSDAEKSLGIKIIHV